MENGTDIKNQLKSNHGDSTCRPLGGIPHFAFFHFFLFHFCARRIWSTRHLNFLNNEFQLWDTIQIYRIGNWVLIEGDFGSIKLDGVVMFFFVFVFSL